MDSVVAARTRKLSKCFGDVIALDQVDLEIAAGELHGLVGPNGAGKTTLLGVLLGLAAPDDGEVEILGTRVSRMLEVPDGVAGFVDGPGLYPSLTARQNLAAFASLRGLRGEGARAIDDALDQLGLTDVADDRLRGFSLGMRQRLGLAAALLTRPRLLVLDEPVNGLDPAGKHQVHHVLTSLAAQGTAVVLSSHRMDDVAALCSRVTILNTGRVAYTGPLRELASRSAVLDHRVVTSDPEATRRIAAEIPDLDLVSAAPGAADDALIARGATAAMDALVTRLVTSGIAVRELGPVIPPLEAAFLALTGSGELPAAHAAPQPARTKATVR